MTTPCADEFFARNSGASAFRQDVRIGAYGSRGLQDRVCKARRKRERAGCFVPHWWVPDALWLMRLQILSERGGCNDCRGTRAETCSGPESCSRRMKAKVTGS